LKEKERKIKEKLEMYQISCSSNISMFRILDMPQKTNKPFAEEWLAFTAKKNLPQYYYEISYIQAAATRGVIPKNLRKFRDEAIAVSNGNIREFNDRFGTIFDSWNDFYLIQENFLLKSAALDSSPFRDFRYEFKKKQPYESRYYPSIRDFYAQYLKGQYTSDIANYNSSHETGCKSYDELVLPERFPANASKQTQEDWLVLSKSILNLLWIRIDSSAEKSYHEFLSAKYSNDINSLNRKYAASYSSFTEIPIIDDISKRTGIVCSDWDSFIQGWNDPASGKHHTPPPETISITGIDFLFIAHLKEKYASIEKMNSALSTNFADWNLVRIPQEDMIYFDFLKNKNAIKRDFSTRNFITAIDYIALHGNALINTVIYCSLSVLCALIVNPLAAYALSRFKPPSTYKVLLFLMLTMAFPPMVTQIPMFLMLREFNLLNSFWALILPGLASGYSIFLLKGFFDSLPQELYESAAIDGASEVRIFFQITMTLSKPILAVIALNAFTSAYSNFMMALLVCQKKEMWTIMPWLYQLQRNAGQGVIFSALILATIPTFIIFLLCQNIIMKGIVVPVEK
jgi:multiple sugar transport system permease protein